MLTMIVCVIAYVLLWNFVFQFWDVNITKVEGNIYWVSVIFIFLPIFFFLMMMVFCAKIGEKFGKYVRDFNY